MTSKPAASFEDRFEVFVRPRLPFIRLSGSGALWFSVALVLEIRACFGGDFPAFWQVGLDRQSCVVELRTCEEGAPGYVRVNAKQRSAQFRSKPLVAWLKAAGVPTARIPARWTAGCVRAQYGQSPAPEPAPAPKKPDAEKVIRSCGHQWNLSEHPGPSGNPVYRCEVCGYYTADTKNPLLEERECEPGFWVDMFEIREDGRVYPKGWNRMTGKEAGK